MPHTLLNPQESHALEGEEARSEGQEGAIPVLDLFAGAGGLSIGLKEAGLNPVGAVEVVEEAALTYEDRHDIEVDRRRLETIPESDLQRWRHSVRVVAAGPPCQPWSTGGLRRAAADERDGFPALLRALRVIEPEVFIIENVAGIERGQTRPYFLKLIRELKALSYRVASQTLNAADFGVPQHRNRMFIIGLRGSLFQFPNPTHGPDGDSAWITAGQVLRNEPVGEPNPSIVTYAKRPHIRPSPFDGLLFNGGGRPVDLAKPARTILASAGGNKTPFLDTNGVVGAYHQALWDAETGKPRVGYEHAIRSGRVPGARRITVEESAQLQSFPNNMSFKGTRSRQYTLVGNAVPPRLAAAVGRAVRSTLTASATPRQ